MLDLGVKIVGLTVGLYTIVSNLWRLRYKKIDPTTRMLIDKLEERDKQIEQLKHEIHVWKKHHERLTNTKHLHSS